GPPMVLPGIPAVNPPNLLPEFSRDGRSLLVIDDPHGKLALFDVATGAEKWSADVGVFPAPGRLGYTGSNEVAVTSGAFVGVETGRTLDMLDAATGQASRVLSLPETGIGSDFLRGGSLLVVDGTAPGTDGSGTISVVRLVDIATGAPLGDPLPKGASPSDATEKIRYFQTAGFVFSSPDGTRFITGTSGPTQSVVLWDVDLDHWEATACRIAGRNLTQAEWNQYLPGQPYHVTCSQWPAGQ
ncbi:MAG: hypothetical protein QOJ67_2712, partial [Acidimicrobiaceae bacterium]